MNADRGQALVVTAGLLAPAALAVVLLIAQQDRLVQLVREQRAGEAAVAAAGAVVADLQLERMRALGRGLDAAELAGFAAEDAVADAARAAAVAIARAHGAAEPSDVRVLSFGVEIEVHLTLAGRRHIALLEPPA